MLLWHQSPKVIDPQHEGCLSAKHKIKRWFYQDLKYNSFKLSAQPHVSHGAFLVHSVVTTHE